MKTVNQLHLSKKIDKYVSHSIEIDPRLLKSKKLQNVSNDTEKLFNPYLLTDVDEKSLDCDIQNSSKIDMDLLKNIKVQS